MGSFKCTDHDQVVAGGKTVLAMNPGWCAPERVHTQTLVKGTWVPATIWLGAHWTEDRWQDTDQWTTRDDTHCEDLVVDGQCHDLSNPDQQYNDVATTFKTPEGQYCVLYE